MLTLGCSGAPWSSCVGDISSHSWAAVEEGFPWASCSAWRQRWLGRSPGSLTFCHRWYLRGARRFASRWCYPWRWFQKTQTLEKTHRNRSIISRFWSPVDSVVVLNVDGAKAAVGDGYGTTDGDGSWARSATHWPEQRVIKTDWQCSFYLSLLIRSCYLQGQRDFPNGIPVLLLKTSPASCTNSLLLPLVW